MARSATWEVRFTDGTSVQVRATSRRMAQAKGSVEARKPPDEIRDYWRVSGKARNGKRPPNPNRNKKRWQRDGYRGPPRRRSFWDDY